MQKWGAAYLTYALTIFLSAFLLFVVQPIVGKRLLPLFGGSSSVWATSLLFFTGMLFVGYLYVYVLTTFGGRRQSLIHAGITAGCALAALLLHSSLDWTTGSAAAPAWNVLLSLMLLIGAPYFLLSTTGPLLQYWYGLASEKEPYKLYALSNAGSLLALVGYIFIVEPFIPLPREQGIWTFLFLICATVTLYISLRSFRVSDTRVAEAQERVSALTICIWIGYAMIPTSLLLATTTTITQTIAPVPLLWIVPLMLYLVALIVAFAGKGQSKYVPALLLVAVYFVYAYRGVGPYYISYEVGADLALLFLGVLFCQVQLYNLRPGVTRLPLFYVLLSFGGMLGILFGSILAPLIFTDFWEFPLCMAIVAILAGWKLPEDFFPRLLTDRTIVLTKIVFGLVSFALFLNLVFSNDGSPYIASRNFYGVVKVQFDDQMTVLMHGSTVHGFQSRSKEWQYAPNSYYVTTSGLGRAMIYEQVARKGADFRAGIIGLGTGSIAAYCRPDLPAAAGRPAQAGDAFIYYEIDPRIIQIAKSDFSYLLHCRGVDVRLGDGRLRLAQEMREGKKGSYDILVVDAFTDDTIPVHLLTLQAIAMYAAHLRTPESIIAIHTSNRYLDLPPVILRIAAQLGLTAKVINDSGSSSEIGAASEWVLLAKDPKVFGAPVFADSKFSPPDMNGVPLWTDDYTSLLRVVDL